MVCTGLYAVPILNRREQQVGPIPEVQVDGLAGDAGRRRDVGNANLQVAALFHQLPGRREDPLARIRRHVSGCNWHRLLSST